MTRELWFQLMQASEDQHGVPFCHVNEDAVELTDAIKDVRHLREAIRQMYRRNDPDILEGVEPSQLRIYCDYAAYKEKKACPPRSPVTELDILTTIIVEVPRQCHFEHAAMVPPADPTEICLTIEEVRDTDENWQELKYYERCGRLIQINCLEYCAQILDKVDEFYHENARPTPFIAVQGSSGMGKSQLAFALRGRRPYFYWLASAVGSSSQRLYRNFRSISHAFHSAVTSDNPKGEHENDIHNSASGFYLNHKLWTYGFICALLNHCCHDEHQSARRMIRFDNAIIVKLKRVDLATVSAVVNKMRAEKKVLPFFVLDELGSSANIQPGGMITSTFQRNVFRACGLVVIVMSTESKITNCTEKVNGSYGVRHKWSALVPIFPRNQIMLNPFEQKRLWTRIVEKYPVVLDILTHSRGRFARYFMEQVLECVVRLSDIELWHLLDEAFANVSKKNHEGKRFLSSEKARLAQLLAIASSDLQSSSCTPNHNADESTIMKVRLEVGALGMQLHFANLVDEEIKDLFAWDSTLETNAGPWKSKCCFPQINDDVLLYLAILGGKAFPSYYDFARRTHYSTKCMFATTNVNNNAVSDTFRTYEKMIAHAVFSSSRRNGVRGIPFDDFFACLLGEFQDELWEKMSLHCKNTSRSMVASDLFEGYAENVSRRTIPFLAPPNATWPPFITDSNRHGCNFGHLVRASTGDRCEVYVQDGEIVKESAALICDCTYWNMNVDMSTVRVILQGLNQRCDCGLVLVFCMQLADCGLEWAQENPNIGCAKVRCQDGTVEWVFQPTLGQRQRLLLIIEMHDGA